MAAVRELRHPTERAWWWFQPLPIHGWNRFDPAWKLLTLTWLTATFSLLTDISSRFLSGGPGTLGAFVVIFQSLIALAGSGTLTKSGQATVEKTLKRWKIPRHWWQEVKFGGASLLLLFFVGFRLALPRIAIEYNNSGFQDYDSGRLDSAESKYERALKLNPDYTEAHYNLGLLYEDLQDLGRARTQYSFAVQSRFAPAHNNLARLEILAENEAAAVNLLQKGIGILEADDQFFEGKEQVRYSLYKNLGWARLQQQRYPDAQFWLERAISVQALEPQAAAHCLLAQALDAQDRKQPALDAWKHCNTYARNPNAPEEDAWIETAKQRLEAAGSQP